MSCVISLPFVTLQTAMYLSQEAFNKAKVKSWPQSKDLILKRKSGSQHPVSILQGKSMQVAHSMTQSTFFVACLSIHAKSTRLKNWQTPHLCLIKPVVGR